MNETKVFCEFYFEESEHNRKKMFNKALTCAKHGKVLYILTEQLNELPQLSQDLAQIDRHYMKMISFLYASNLQALIESVVTLPTWQNVPSTIILDDLSEYCRGDNIQTACGVIALFIDIADSCSNVLKSVCRFYLSAQKDKFSEENITILKELYIRNLQQEHVTYKI